MRLSNSSKRLSTRRNCDSTAVRKSSITSSSSRVVGSALMAEAYPTIVAGMFPRLFVGIALDATARAAGVKACQALQLGAFDAKYEASEKLHATLAFLGNVAPEQIN